MSRIIRHVFLIGVSTVCLAQEQAPSNRDAAEAKFPSSYDSKVLEGIGQLKLSDFAYPVVSVLRPDSVALANKSTKAAYVWLQLKIGLRHAVTECKVLYCSTPDEGFEETALKVVKGRPFYSLDEKSDWKWLWHQVLFTGTCGSVCRDTLDLPHPGDSSVCDTSPTAIVFNQPEYPSDCMAVGRSGITFVKALVDRSGSVVSAMIDKSSDDMLLDAASLAAAYGNHFKPALSGGRPIPSWVTYRVAFKLNDNHGVASDHSLPDIMQDFSGIEIPITYDSTILEKVWNVSPRERAFPCSTDLNADSLNLTLDSTRSAYVWLKLRTNDYSCVSDLEIVYCSQPGKGLEAIAAVAVTNQQFLPLEGSSSSRWLFHRVAFERKKPRARVPNATVRPDDDGMKPVEKQPEMTSMRKPEYPSEVVRLGMTGLVWVKALVDRRGAVREALVGKSSGVKLLDRAAVAAAYGNKFSPAEQDGHPVAIWVAYRVEFKLNQQ